MIEIHTPRPGITLRGCRDGRFKQGCISIQLVRPMDAAEAAMNALIPTVLLRGTRHHPDLRSVTMALDDLYGAAVSPLVRRVGDYQTTGLYCGFMDPRFALPGDRVLEPMIDFLRELLLESPTEDGGFLPEFVESEKRNLISSIECERNDKQVYAMSRLLETMCRGDSFGLPRLGTCEQVAAITPKALYDHYQKILRESEVHLFYVGSEEPARVAQLLAPLFGNRHPAPLPPQTGLRCSEPQNLTEHMDVTQGKLCLGLTTPVTNQDEDFAAMQLLNAVLGGDMTSKLFMNVREKLSLCYSISSHYYGAKGVMTVSAGIDFDQRARVEEEITRQLEACRRGDITQEELTAARESLISSLRSTHDTPGAIEGYYATAALSGIQLTPDTYMEALNRVTAEKIAEMAKITQLHSSFFLCK